MFSLEKYKRFLSIAANNTDKDVFLQECIDFAVGEAERSTNRVLSYRLVKRYLSGDGSNTINLREYPVGLVTVLKYFDGSAYVDILTSPDTISNSVVLVKPYKAAFIKDYCFACGTDNIYTEFYAGFKWAAAWAASKAYLVNDLVMYNSNMYICDTAHTSGSVFDASKWSLHEVAVIPADLEKAMLYNAAMIFYESPAGCR